MSSYLSSNAKPDYPLDVRRFADSKLFSGGSRYGVVREAHRLQKYSTPISVPTDVSLCLRPLPNAFSRRISFAAGCLDGARAGFVPGIRMPWCPPRLVLD